MDNQINTALWRIILGAVLVLALPLLAATALAVVLVLLNPALGDQIVFIVAGHNPLGVMLALGIIAASLPALALVMRYLHKARLAVLFGRWRPRWFAIAAALLLAAHGLLFLIAPPTPIFSGIALPQWLAWLAPALVLILLQTATEELVFRGYLQTMLLARFRRLWLALLLPSVLFALGHYDPATFGPNAWLAVAAIGVWGLMMAHLTWQSGSLLPAMGLHFANNVFAILILTNDGPLSGLALYVTLADLRDPVIGSTMLWVTIAQELALYALYQLGRWLYLRRQRSRARTMLHSAPPPSI